MTITRHILKVSAIILGVSLAGYLLDLSIHGSEILENTLEILAELFSIFVSFSIFGVTWYAYSRSRDNHALFLGAAFLVIGFIDLFHVLSYPFMPDFITPNPPEKSAVFWNMARTISALLFLASAYLYNLNCFYFPPYNLKSTAVVSFSKSLNPIISSVFSEIPVKFRCHILS